MGDGHSIWKRDTEVMLSDWMTNRGDTGQDQKIRILLIEDSPTDAGLLTLTLHDDPLGSKFEVANYLSLADGLHAAKTGSFDAMLLDLNLPDSNGFETVERAIKATTQVPIVVLTSIGGEELAKRAVAQGAQDFIFKDRLDPYWVAHAIRHAIGRHLLSERARMAELREIQAAQQANNAKSEFLAALSHEIRTPIGAIIMASDALLAVNTVTHESRELATMIRRNGDHLLALINDVLDLSKVEAGCMTTTEESMSLQALTRELISAYRPMAVSRRNQVHADCAPSLPDQISLDPMRLRQIITNLLGNALKFTEGGSIWIRASVDNSGAEPRLIVAVEDTGIGIPKNQQKNLFRRFGQADKTVQRKYGGTGLGLVLSQKIAAAMGGSLALTQSTPGQGSTFTVALPLRIPPKCSDLPTTDQQTPKAFSEVGVLSGRRVLLVDDNPDILHLYGNVLKSAGAEVLSALDGAEGVESALQGQFDVVLMDMQMPKLDGLAATNRLRQLGYQRPIIALTANDRSDDQKRCTEAGYDDFLPKPVSSAFLVKAVAEACRDLH